MADEWLARVYAAGRNIGEMSADECDSLLKRTEAIPAYRPESHRRDIGSLRLDLEKRMEELEVQGLIVGFQKLSKKLRREFVRLAELELKREGHHSGHS
jgi:hypothetical protein